MDELVDINTVFGPLPMASTDLTVDALLTLMQKHHVAAACTLSTLGLLLDANIGNTATRAACDEHKNLLPAATLNPTSFLGDRSALERLKAEGFRLVRFFPEHQGWPLDFAPFRDLVASLNVTGLPIMVDVSRPGNITALEAILGSYEAPVILAGVNASLLAEAVSVLRRHANWHLETSRLLSAGGIHAVAELLGAERLLFGTASPSQPVAGALHALQYAGLPDDMRRQICATNARRLLGI